MNEEEKKKLEKLIRKTNLNEEERDELEKLIHEDILKNDSEYRKFRLEEEKLRNEREEIWAKESDRDQTVIITVTITLFIVGILVSIF